VVDPQARALPHPDHYWARSSIAGGSHFDFAVVTEANQRWLDPVRSPELIFDQGVGDLFVVRVAGNAVSGTGPFIKGSVEFAVAELGARLVVVLGHGACGAIKAAVAHIDANDTLPGAIRDLVKVIRPAAQAVRGKPGNKVDNAIKANVELGIERLRGLDPILADLVKKGELKIVGAVYELRTGTVKWLD
jgi:carbonic anhydrase